MTHQPFWPVRGPARATHDVRPPRYRLLRAAAQLPQREPYAPMVRFERECPACGTAVMFTQIVVGDGVEYVVADHPCRKSAEPSG